ncbi:MAG: hypothetical protein ACJAYF_003117 [Arenicella sp.]|jgi:hypothetical protein
MPNYESYDYNQSSMIVINYQDQLSRSTIKINYQDQLSRSTIKINYRAVPFNIRRIIWSIRKLI